MSWNPDEYPEDVSTTAMSVLDEVQEEHSEVVAHEQAAVESLGEAMKRIEEANLWKTLLNTDIFQSGSARPEIVSAINLKLKKFALSNLEKCVGIGGKEEAPTVVRQEVKLPFDSEELQALKILAAKVLKRDVTQAVLTQGYTPSVAQVGSTASTAAILKVGTQASASPVSLQRTSAQTQKPATPQKTVVKPQNKRIRPGPGYIPQPPSGYMPMAQGTPTVSAQGVSGATVGQVNMQNLVSNLIQQASGGNILATATASPAVDDINERF
jgi:hypothetical protein